MKVDFPASLSPAEEYLFPDLSYEENIQNLTYAKKVYVTKSGIVFKHFRILRASVHRYSYLYFTFLKVAVASFFFKKEEKSF